MDVVRDALRIERTAPFEWLVRAGFVARGVTYGIIGGVAVALAAGAGSRPSQDNQEGALGLIGQVPMGQVALGVIAAGLLAYALWKLAQAAFGIGPEGGGGPRLFDRAANLGGGVTYLAFFAVAMRVLLGSAGNSSRDQRKAAAGVLGWPAGQFLVAAAGVCLIAISAYQVYEALTAHFMRDNKVGQMSGRERRTFGAVGRVGLTARALVFALVGYFLVKTAIDFKPSRGISLDGALAQVHREPYGAWLLGLVAAGLLVFTAYSFFEARYRRL